MNKRQTKKHAEIIFSKSPAGDERYLVIFKNRYQVYKIKWFFAKDLDRGFKDRLALVDMDNGLRKIGLKSNLHFSHNGKLVNG